MEQPLGFVDFDNPSFVCCLKKAIYRLQQAPWAWYTELRNYLLSVGFQNFLADTFLFTLCHGSISVYMLVYVDDNLVTCNDENTF